MTCEKCERTREKLYKHHIVPKVKGGAKKGMIPCCRTCSRHIHMLFSENELARMTMNELLNTEEMKKYITWIQKRKRDYKVRLSRRLRR